MREREKERYGNRIGTQISKEIKNKVVIKYRKRKFNHHMLCVSAVNNNIIIIMHTINKNGDIKYIGRMRGTGRRMLKEN